jgi:hypothetical protein
MRAQKYGVKCDAPTALIIQRLAPYNRRICDVAPAASIMRNNGMHITSYFGNESAAEMLALFASADLIVGYHGAGLINIVFSKPSATVLEFVLFATLDLLAPPRKHWPGFTYRSNTAKLCENLNGVRCATIGIELSEELDAEETAQFMALFNEGNEKRYHIDAEDPSNNFLHGRAACINLRPAVFVNALEHYWAHVREDALLPTLPAG